MKFPIAVYLKKLLNCCNIAKVHIINLDHAVLSRKNNNNVITIRILNNSFTINNRERIIVPTVLCVDETWGKRLAERSSNNMLGMQCLISMVKVHIQRMSLERLKWKGNLSNRVDQSVLQWFGHTKKW